MIERSARAKINLHLHITGRREDGYHLLDSLVARLSLADKLKISAATSYQFSSIRLSCDCSTEDNLVTRAMRLVTSHTATVPHIKIELEKNIPSGAGLGGGSTDAATTLLALNEFWNLNLSIEKLHDFAAQLGSDIAACLPERPVIMRDTGNTLLPAPKMPELYGVLVAPPTPCPTPLVYKTYAASGKSFSSPVSFPDKFYTSKDCCDFLKKHTHNDLTEAAIEVNPDVGNVLNRLEECNDPLLVRMSGSGSSCYALFNDEDTAIKQSYAIGKTNPDWFIKAIRVEN